MLAARYRSWTLPLAILPVEPTGVLAALAGVQLRGQDNAILTQIGLIVLIGLAAKNAILIVEFAHQLETRDGKGPVEVCRLRLRPILMTALAFILGATVFGLFLTPTFYVVIRRAQLRLRPRRVPAPASGAAPS